MANTGNTQQNINYGATANDGTGDPLRTAFIKVDENFDNVWLAGPVGSNITITDNTIQNNSTNGNIILKPNGVGVIQANAAIVPSAANVRDIGTSALPFRAGYFGVGGLTVDGNVTITGNLTAGNIKYTSNVFVGDLQGSVFADDSTIMVDAIDNSMFADSAVFGTVSATGNVTGNYFIGNGSQLTGITSSYGNSNVATYLNTGLAGNIIPGANLTYSLGNSTNWWSNIWVASNTIYIGGVALGVTGNTLTVAGEPVLSNDSNSSITTSGTITANAFAFTGAAAVSQLDLGGNNKTLQITATSADGSETANLLFGWDNTNFALSVPAETDIVGNLDVNGNVTAGNLTVTNIGQLGDLVFENGYVSLDAESASTQINISPDAEGQAFLQIPNDATANTANVRLVNSDGNVRIETNAGNIWTFGVDGTLTLPGESHLYSDSTSVGLNARNGDGITVDGDGIALTTSHPVTILTNVLSDPKSWVFDDAGNLTLPGNTFAVNYANGTAVSLGGDYGDSNVATFLAAYGSNTVSTTGNITAGNMQATSYRNSSGASILGDFVINNNTIQTSNGDGGITLSIFGGDGADPPALIDKAWLFGNTGTFSNPGAIDATGNITGANLITANGANVILGNSSSYVKQSGSNATVGLQGSVFLNPDTSASATNGVVIGGSGYLLGPSQARNAVLNYNGGSGTMGIFTVNIYGNQATAITNGGSNGVGNIGANATNRFDTAFLAAVDASGNVTAGNIITGVINNTSDISVTSDGNIEIVADNDNGEWGFFIGADGEILVSAANLATVGGGNLFSDGTITALGNATAGNLTTAGTVAVDTLTITNNRIDAVTQFAIATSNTVSGNSSSILLDRNGSGVGISLEDTSGGPYSWSFGQDNILFPDGSRQYSAYGNANVVANLAALGSNPISTTGNVTAGNINANVAGYSIGYRDIPQVSFTGNATIATTDAGKHFYSTESTDYVLTIANNASQGFQVGAAISIVNQGTGNITIAEGSGVSLYLAGNATSGNRTLSTFGMATIMKVATDTWFINGTGVA